jgi:hypothetical protein
MNAIVQASRRAAPEAGSATPLKLVTGKKKARHRAGLGKFGRGCLKGRLENASSGKIVQVRKTSICLQIMQYKKGALQFRA